MICRRRMSTMEMQGKPMAKEVLTEKVKLKKYI